MIIPIALAALFFLGCAAAPVPAPEPAVQAPLPQCEAGEFRGFGADEAGALSDLAKQINSSVKVVSKHSVSQQRENGNENLSSNYDSKSVIKASLLNAHDARVVYNKEGSAVVCMSRANAAKPYIQMQSLLLDSLGKLSAADFKAANPRQKNESRSRANSLWVKMLSNSDLLASLGIAGDIGKAKEYRDSIESDYKDYCQSARVHWESSEDECSAAAFAMLSKNTGIEKSECSGGIKLRFACAGKCRSLSFGVECSFEPSLSIESCEGEMYSLLRANEPVAGTDMHNEGKARENTLDNLAKSAFFYEWEKEIREWVPKCID